MTARNHGSSLDTLRWGDVESIAVPAAGETLAQFTKQLVQAHWRWPLTWQLQLSFHAELGTNVTETADFLFDVEFTVGAGQAKMTYVETFTMTNASGYADVAVSRALPAQDLQLRVFARSSKAVVQAAQLIIGAMVAPITEPHVMIEMLDNLEGQRHDQVEWMREGFHPQPLHYRR